MDLENFGEVLIKQEYDQEPIEIYEERIFIVEHCAEDLVEFIKEEGIIEKLANVLILNLRFCFRRRFTCFNIWASSRKEKSQKHNEKNRKEKKN